MASAKCKWDPWSTRCGRGNSLKKRSGCLWLNAFAFLCFQYRPPFYKEPFSTGPDIIFFFYLFPCCKFASATLQLLWCNDYFFDVLQMSLHLTLWLLNEFAAICTSMCHQLFFWQQLKSASRLAWFSFSITIYLRRNHGNVSKNLHLEQAEIRGWQDGREIRSAFPALA